MTAAQQKAIEGMKRSVQILRAVARDCSDLEAADDVAREANLIAGQIVALEKEAQRPALELAA